MVYRKWHNLGLLQLEPIDRHLQQGTNNMRLNKVSMVHKLIAANLICLEFLNVRHLSIHQNLQPWGWGRTETPSLGSGWWFRSWCWPDQLSSPWHQPDMPCNAPWLRQPVCVYCNISLLLCKKNNGLRLSAFGSSAQTGIATLRCNWWERLKTFWIPCHFHHQRRTIILCLIKCHLNRLLSQCQFLF